MIYITGDLHIPIDIQKLNTKQFPEQKNLSKEDYLIICGDFGGIWNNGNEEQYWLKWFNNKNFTTLFVDGNHENYELLNKYPIREFKGGNIHQIRENIFHLMRGQVFDLCGKKFFTMGGASSHDKKYRIENRNWWSQELPSDEEYQKAICNLELYNWKVDYIITHCISDSIQRTISTAYEENKLTNFFETIDKKIFYHKWFFAHYHIDKEIDEKHICVFNNIISI